MTYTAPTAHQLHLRLFQLGAVESHPDSSPALTAEDAEQAIHGMMASEAVCCRCTVDGKTKLLRFREMWEAVFQRKWKWPSSAAKGAA